MKSGLQRVLSEVFAHEAEGYSFAHSTRDGQSPRTDICRPEYMPRSLKIIINNAHNAVVGNDIPLVFIPSSSFIHLRGEGTCSCANRHAQESPSRFSVHPNEVTLFQDREQNLEVWLIKGFR